MGLRCDVCIRSLLLWISSTLRTTQPPSPGRHSTATHSASAMPTSSSVLSGSTTDPQDRPRTPGWQVGSDALRKSGHPTPCQLLDKGHADDTHRPNELE